VKLACSRTWEVEALEDGRLEGADRVALERHVRTCLDCRRELAAIESVTNAVSAFDADAREPTSLEERRLRSRILREANRRIVSPEAPRRWWAIPAAACVAMLGVLVAWQWSKSAAAPTETVVALAKEPPALAATERNVVDDVAAEEPAIAQSTSTKPPPPPSATSRPRAGERFDHAMAAFGAGRYADADAELEAFASSFPTDPRCEDAAFLRAVARFRLGDSKAAAALARDYLRDYPSGLRRAEARQLAADLL
jgi:TolA-binding protein